MALDVSRETKDRLTVYVDLLTKWTQRINLISADSASNIWDRHVADSLQLLDHVEPRGHWVDLGSGGGFPGLVIAICASDQMPDLRVTLIEADARKSTFLRTVLRETHTQAEVLTARIEAAPRQNADILSARALAPLDRLLDYTERHLSPSGTALFPKGVKWKKELADAQRRWKFLHDIHKSKTSPESVILSIKELAHV